MFAALYAPSLPAAAVIDVARAFTPRFEQLGSVVLLDASGLSHLFGSAQELGDHLRDALSKLSPGDTLPRIAIASTQTASTLLALGCPGLTVVIPGKEAIAPGALGWLITALIGIAGAFLGTWLAFWRGAGYAAGWIMSIVGAVILLLLYRFIAAKMGRTTT